jgi:hypothetical protein
MQQHQQQYQQQQQENAVTSMAYQPGQFPVTTATTPVSAPSANMMNRRSIQVQPYSSTWAALGVSSMAKMFPPQSRNVTTDGTQRPTSLTTTSMRHLGMQPPQIQTNFMQPQLGMDRSMYSASCCSRTMTGEDSDSLYNRSLGSQELCRSRPVFT